MTPVTTRRLTSLLLIFITPVVWSSCDIDNTTVKAQYRISTSVISNTHTNIMATEQKPDKTLILWRYKNQVVHQYPQQQVSELWQRQKNQRLKLVRQFDQQRKGIEYQANEISHRSATDWCTKSTLISSAVLAQLKRDK
ncbi:MAG: hypothetical protein ACI8WB_003097, partial [Phenylobacterium sp.]